MKSVKKFCRNVAPKILLYLVPLGIAFALVGYFEWARFALISIVMFFISFFQLARCVYAGIDGDSLNASRRYCAMLVIAFGSFAVAIGMAVAGLTLGFGARDQVFLYRLNEYNEAREGAVAGFFPGPVELHKIPNFMKPKPPLEVAGARDANGVVTFLVVTGYGCPANEYGYMYASDGNPKSPYLPSFVYIRKKIAPNWFAIEWH